MVVLVKDGSVLNYTEVVPNSPDFSWGPDGSSGTRIIDVAWEDLDLACRLFLGYETVVFVEALNANYISRVLPETMPGRPQLVCRKVARVEGIGQPGKDPAFDLAAYDTARLHLQYQSVLWNLAADDDVIGWNGLPDESLLLRNVIKLTEPEGQFITIPFGAMKFGDDNSLVMSNGTGGIPRYDPRDAVTFQWVDVPCVPDAAIRSCLGCINDADFAGYPVGTLLFAGWNVQPSPPSIAGIPRYQIKYRMQFWPKFQDDGVTPTGHNYLPKFVKGQGPTPARIVYTQVYSDGTQGGSTLYRSADFTTLFRPDQP
jgi:hypothetical protein